MSRKQRGTYARVNASTASRWRRRVKSIEWFRPFRPGKPRSARPHQPRLRTPSAPRGPADIHWLAYSLRERQQRHSSGHSMPGRLPNASQTKKEPTAHGHNPHQEAKAGREQEARARRGHVKAGREQEPSPPLPRQSRPEQEAEPAAGTQLTCPECGKTFTRPASLGAHRQRAHGIAGTSQNARSRRTTRRGTTAQTTARKATSASNGASAAVDHDALLRALFPAGIPPRQDIIAAVNDWLSQADTLARQR